MERHDDAVRTARLAFAAELKAGVVTDRDLDRPQVLRRLAPRPVPPGWRCSAESVAMKAGLLTYWRNVLADELKARHAVLGDANAGAPRLLVRVDEFPDSSAYDNPDRAGLEASRRFHAIMNEAGVPYLMAIVPQLTSHPLDPGGSGGRPLGEKERALIAQMADDGVAFAQHGTTHRTRRSSPRKRSELSGLSPSTVGTVIDRGLCVLRDIGIDPQVFVPPFNHFDRAHYEVLASRFSVVCGGPETVRVMGFQRGPQWRGEAVFLPSYPPLYGRAREILPAVERLTQAQVGVSWVPIVLHLAWEADDGWNALARLAEVLAPLATRWNVFLDAVARTR